MDWLTETFLSLVADQNNPVALMVMAAASALEYVFPPFPGDTITLLGAILVTGYGWNVGLIFAAVMIGSVGGALVAFKFGLVWAKRRDAKRNNAANGAEPLMLDELVAKFHRHGPIYLVLNRFLPGLRALFFVAAGLAKMRTLPVVIYSAVSAALWNVGLIAVGALVGANLDELKSWVSRYTLIVWILIATLAVGFGLRFAIKRRGRSISSNVIRSEQDATGQDAAGQDAAGKDAAGQDAAGQDAAGKDAAGQDAAGQDATKQDTTG